MSSSDCLHHINRFVLPLLILAFVWGGSGCSSPDDPAPEKETFRIPHPDEIQQRNDGLFYQQGADAPFSGVAAKTDPERGMRLLVMYHRGKKTGPEVTWYDNGNVRRITDYRDNEKDRHREWYENGNPKRDARFENGFATGLHQKWHDNGRLGFVGIINQDEESMKWDGHVVDHDENGELVVDAFFDNGRYIGGIFPLAKDPKPKPIGREWVWEETE